MREEYAVPDRSERKIAKESESMESKRLYVNEDGSEYVEVNPELAAKIHELLKSQEDIRSDDVEAVLIAGDKLQGANCHKTALYLANKISKDELFDPHNTDPETAGHEYVEAHSQLYPDKKLFFDALRQMDFPYRISFFKPKDGKDFAYHSVMVIGISNKNTLVGFEKRGPYADNLFAYVKVNDSISRHILRGYTPSLEV